MSRKAKVPEEAKKKWTRPRLTIASLGYDYWKQPADSLLRNTLVFIEHNDDRQKPDRGRHDNDPDDVFDLLHVARKMRSSARAILLNPDDLETSTFKLATSPRPGNVLYLDVSPLVNPESLKEEFLSPALQGITKALAKTLQRLHLAGATLAAHGEGAGLLLKVLLGNRKAGVGRVLSGEQAKGVLLLHPILPPALVNAVIAPAEPSDEFGDVTVVYKDEKTRDSRHAVIESVLLNATPLVLQGDVSDDLLQRCYFDKAESSADKDSGFDCTDCCETTADDQGPGLDEIDAMGRRIFYSSLGGSSPFIFHFVILISQPFF